MNLLPFAKQVTVIRALCDGNSIRGTSRIVGVDKNTVMWLGRDVGEGYARLHDELFLGLHCDFIEVDEAWSFVQKKQAHVEPDDAPECGDQYAYVALADGGSVGRWTSMAKRANSDSTTIGESMETCLKALVDCFRWHRGFRRGWADKLAGASGDPFDHCKVDCPYLEGHQAGWDEADREGDVEASLADWDCRRRRKP